jgi:hypothetical protein
MSNRSSRVLQTPHGATQHRHSNFKRGAGSWTHPRGIGANGGRRSGERACQLQAGAAAARGDWILFLHADTELEAGWSDAIRSFINAPESSDHAGYFRFALDEACLGARRLERLVSWRNQLMGLPYGDQGLLISQALYEKVGGYRAYPLMEDVDLVRRLGRRRLRRLDVRATTSAERYRRDGYWHRPARNLLCLALYYIGFSPHLIKRVYG